MNDDAVADLFSNSQTFESLIKLPTEVDGIIEADVSMTEQMASERERAKGKEEVGKILEKIDCNLQKKLFHQFTIAFTSYLFDAQYASQWTCSSEPIAFLVRVVKPVMTKLSPMTLLNTLQRVGDTCKGLAALKVIQLFESAIRSSNEAFLLYKSMQAFHLLHGGFVEECRDLLFEQLEPSIDKTFGLSGRVQAEFHRAAAAYCWKTQELDEFYKHAMFYLQGADLDTVGVADRIDVAKSLCRAVLLSDKIFSFTELLQSPILDCISPGGPGHPTHSLIRDLVVICNSGDHQMFNFFVTERQTQLETENLSAHLDKVGKKVTIFALLELAFMKPQKSKILTFKEIATACRVDIKDVELLVMKVMSHGLMTGSIDEIDQIVTFTSLQPRLLDGPKIRALSEHFRNWNKQVSSVVASLERMAPEIFSSGN